ncbi:MAG: ABC transporter ATP-binding protein [Planctomycetota bacterium]
MSTKVERHSKNTDSPAVIRANSLSKSFDDVNAIRNSSFHIFEGSTTALVGANGCGKSTLLKMLYGLCIPDKGEVSICGHNPFQTPKHLYSFARYLSQQISLDGEMTGEESLLFFAKLYGIPPSKINQQLSSITQHFGLSEILTRRIANLSGGMKQRIHLSICLLGESSVMLLDEPTSNLDPDGKREFWSWAKGYSKSGGTIILSTHDLKNAESHASQVIMLDQGSIILDEPPEKIVQQHSRPIIFATTENRELAQKAKITLETTEFIKSVDILDENQIVIVLSNADTRSNDAAVMAELQKNAVSLQSYRRETGLASAYYLLAGRRSEIHAREGLSRGRARGRRH